MKRAILFAAAACLFSAAVIAHAQQYVLMDRPTSLVHVYNQADDSEIGAGVRTGASPDFLALAPGGRIGYIANLNSGYMSVVDFTLGAEIARVHGVRTRWLAFNADASLLIALNFSAGDTNVAAEETLQIVDTKSLAIVKSINLNGMLGDQPGIADIQAEGVATTGNIAWVNTNFGVARVNMLPPYDVSVVPGSNVGFLRFGAAVTSNGKYLVADRGGPAQLLVIDTAAGAIATSIPLSGPPQFVIADGNTVWLIRNSGGAIAVEHRDLSADPTSPGFGAILAQVRTSIVFGGHDYLGLSPDGSRLFVSRVGYNFNPNFAEYDTAKLLTDPANALIEERSLLNALQGMGVGAITTTPPSSAPTVSAVVNTSNASYPGIAVNNQPNTLTVTGSNFLPGALVRIGELDPIPASGVSGSSLTVTLSPGAPAENADIVVTNPDPDGTVAGQHQSGLLKNGLVVASPPTFQPAQQVVVLNFGHSTVSTLNMSTNATITPTTFAGVLEPVSIDITPDGERAYISSFNNAVIADYRLVTSTAVQPPIPIGAGPNADNVTGQITGLAVAPNPLTGNPQALVATGGVPDPNTGAEDELLNIIDAYPGTSASPNPNFDTNRIQPGPSETTFPLSVRGALAVTADGRYVYSSRTNADVNTGNAVAGILTVWDTLAGTSQDLDLSSLGVAWEQLHIEIAGHYMVLASPDSSSLLVFNIANPYALQLVGASTGVATGASAPAFAAWRVTGGHLYAFDSQNNTLQVFNFDPANNNFAWLQMASVTGYSFVGDMAVTPDESLVYISMGDNDAVVVFNGMLPNNTQAPLSFITSVHTDLSPATLALRPGTPTAAGTNVSVSPIQQASITFDSITTSGATSVTTTNTNPLPLPAGFSLGNPPIYYEISTTATFAGNAQVCFSYNPAQFTGPESSMRLLHDTNGSWVDVTTSQDLTNHVICGEVTSFSPFTIGVGSIPYLFQSLVDDLNRIATQAGERRSLLAKAIAARASWQRGDNSTAVSQLTALNNEIAAQNGMLITPGDAQYLTDDVNSIIGRLQ